jgi:hypothetical protein
MGALEPIFQFAGLAVVGPSGGQLSFRYFVIKFETAFLVKVQNLLRTRYEFIDTLALYALRLTD